MKRQSISLSKLDALFSSVWRVEKSIVKCGRVKELEGRERSNSKSKIAQSGRSPIAVLSSSVISRHHNSPDELLLYSAILWFIAILFLDMHPPPSLVQVTSGPSEYSSEACYPIRCGRINSTAFPSLYQFSNSILITSDLFLINSRQSQWRGQTRTKTCCTAAWATPACTCRPLG